MIEELDCGVSLQLSLPHLQDLWASWSNLLLLVDQSSTTSSGALMEASNAIVKLLELLTFIEEVKLLKSDE